MTRTSWVQMTVWKGQTVPVQADFQVVEMLSLEVTAHPVTATLTLKIGGKPQKFHLASGELLGFRWRALDDKLVLWKSERDGHIISVSHATLGMK